MMTIWTVKGPMGATPLWGWELLGAAMIAAVLRSAAMRG